jgi:hypothetical protein
METIASAIALGSEIIATPAKCDKCLSVKAEPSALQQRTD